MRAPAPPARRKLQQMRGARRLFGMCALALSAHALQITGPPELLEQGEANGAVFRHSIGCLGRRFRFITPFERPVTQVAQYRRAWGDYRSLPPYSRDLGLTTGRLLLAMPRDASGLPSGCDEVQTYAAEYGDATMIDQICLVSRGGICTFGTKIKNCEAAGAKAVVIFNRQGSGEFMIGPDRQKYSPATSIGVMTVPYELYQQSVNFFPNVTVAMEPQFELPLVAARNCTAEALGHPGRPEDGDSSQFAWTETEVAQCESEVSAAEAAAVSGAVADGLFSGELVTDGLKTVASDDPYSDCILEQPCSETWQTVPVYTYTVASVGTVLMLCFLQITAMFCFGASRKPMKGRKPRLKFCCCPRCSPHLRCCKCCPIFPLFYKKPQEFLNTGMWRFFLYTWPFMPRSESYSTRPSPWCVPSQCLSHSLCVLAAESDPKMTFLQRILVTVMCTLVGLITLMILGNTGVKYKGMRSGSGIEVAGEAYESALADMEEEQSADWLEGIRKPLNMFICVTVQEICKQIVSQASICPLSCHTQHIERESLVAPKNRKMPSSTS